MQHLFALIIGLLLAGAQHVCWSHSPDVLRINRNPTAHLQVVEEHTRSGPGILSRPYTYGLDLISQRDVASGTALYFGYDGLGSTRLLTDAGGAVVNVFAYDAYGNLISSNTAPQTVYLFTGEQFDPNLGFYYLRARYLNTGTGRFWTRDTWEGNQQDPLSLHRYLYAHANPVNGTDPSGHEFSLISFTIANAIGTTLDVFYNAGVINLGFFVQDSLLEVLIRQTVSELFMTALSSGAAVEDPVAFVSARLREMGVSAGDAEAYAFREYFDFAVLPLLLDEHEYVDNDLDHQDASCTEPQCFVAGTKVLTADGLRRIEEIKVGDRVWAYDTAMSNVVLKSVVRTFTRERSSLVVLEVDDDVIKVTPEHPFFVLGRGWTRADALQQGDKLLTFDAKNDAHVRRSEKQNGRFVVYNFEVEGLHNYFVAHEAVLVHNLGRGYHHFVTRGLGSRISYGHRILRQAGRLTVYQHTHLHREPNRHLRTYTKGKLTMMPSRGNPGRLVVRTFSKQERLTALGNFYRSYKGGKYYPHFQRELKYLKQHPNLFL